MVIEYKKIGEVKPKHSKEIISSKLGIGLEKLDRDVFDPTSCYDYIGKLGVKWVRIQSGWTKTEKTKGVYDFNWLDNIVNSLIAQGVAPWICLCYGNALYTKQAEGVQSGIGIPPVFSEEEKAAWINYIKATAEHFKGRVAYYEVWNEPDGIWCWKHGVNGTEYGEMLKSSGKAIKEVDPDAKVIGGSVALYHMGLGFVNDMLATGSYKYIDAMTYHDYGSDNFDEEILDKVSTYKALLASYNPNIKLIQGEVGVHSKVSPRGAVNSLNWTEEKQAKFLARRMIADLISNVYFTSYFTMVDMYENLTGSTSEKTEDMYGFYGVLREEFIDGKATGVYSPKPSYKAMQTICSLFAEDCEIVDAPIKFSWIDPTIDVDSRLYDYPPKLKNRTNRSMYATFKKNNNSFAFVYWCMADIVRESYDSYVMLDVCCMPEKINVINAVSGEVFEIPEECIEQMGNSRIIIKSLPFRDYPMIVTFGDFIDEII